MRTGLFPSSLLLAALLSCGAQAAPFAADHITVELLSDDTAIAPGKPALFGLHLIHESHWHTYWTNPGDSGLPTQIAWHLPDGFKAADIAWPTPERFTSGELYNIGYDGDVLLPVSIDVPAGAKVGSNAHIAADVKWLVCREECVPGKTSFAFDLPLREAAQRNARSARLFDASHGRAPLPAAWNGDVQVHDARVEVNLNGAGIPAGENLDAFVVQRRIVGNGPPRITSSDKGLTLVFARSDYYTSPPAQIDVVLRHAEDDNVQAWTVTLPFNPAADPSNPPRNSP